MVALSAVLAVVVLVLAGVWVRYLTEVVYPRHMRRLPLTPWQAFLARWMWIPGILLLLFGLMINGLTIWVCMRVAFAPW